MIEGMLEDRLENYPEGVEGLPLIIGGAVAVLASVIAIPLSANWLKKVITGSQEKQALSYYKTLIESNLSENPPNVIAIFNSLDIGHLAQIKSASGQLQKGFISPSADLHNLILITDKTGRNLILAGSGRHIAQTYTDSQGVTDYAAANDILDEALAKNKSMAGFLEKETGILKLIPFLKGKTYYQIWKEELQSLESAGTKLSPLTGKESASQAAATKSMLYNIAIVGGVGVLMLLTYFGIKREIKKRKK